MPLPTQETRRERRVGLRTTPISGHMASQDSQARQRSTVEHER